MRALETFFARLERLGADDFGRLSLPLPEPSARARILRNVEDAAKEAGRSALLEDTRATARRFVENAYARRMYEPTWIGLNWGRSSGTVRDRAVVLGVVEDAASAAVVADLVGPDVVPWLGEPFESLAALSGTADASESLTRPGWVGYIAVALFLIAVFLAVAGSSRGRKVGALARALNTIRSLETGTWTELLRRRREPGDNRRPPCSADEPAQVAS